MSIPQSFIQELLTRADVVEIVGRYVPLKKSGANFMGLCPFHGEKSPSFSVSPTKQFYHCFGCGKNGNAIGFLMDHAGMSFVEAVHDLAQQYGLQVPQEQSSAQDRAQAAQQRQQQATLTDVLEKACTAYQKQLKNSQRAIDYLKQRGLSGEVAKQFGLGYAPAGWHHLAGVFPHYDDPLLVDSGLLITSEAQGDSDSAGQTQRYDRFRDRIMFPIRNVKGECIGFGGRVLGDEKPKYLNSPETPVFSKGRELYGLFEARHALREAGYVLVTEGYMDVVALAQLGFANAVATLGTACTSEHVQKLFRFTDSVVFSFDGDEAGRRAARKALDGALPYASDVRSVKFLFLPPEHDPDSFIRERGTDAFAQCVREATPLSRFLIDAASEGCDLGSAEGRARLASQAHPLWQTLPEGVLKTQLLSELADLVQLHPRELLGLWQPRLGSGAGAAQGRRQASARPGTPIRAYAAPTSGHGAGAAAQRPSVVRTTKLRTAPSSRADHAVRLLLTHMAAWESLSHEDHSLLCALPAPHGPLFGWIDSQCHEHGPQPWAALREGLRGQAFEASALRIMGTDNPVIDAEAMGTQLQQELAQVLNRLWIEQLKQQETQAIQAAASDPNALGLYRQLQAQRREREAAAELSGQALDTAAY